MYQWLEWAPGGSYAAVGSDSASFSFVTSGATATGRWSFILQVTDNAGAAVNSAAVSVTVNSGLVAPTVTPTPGTMDQGQTSTLTSSSVTTGTSPYTYQWLERSPDGSYAMVGSDSASFSFVTSGATATGRWSFILQVKDNAGAAVNSAAVSVTVNPTISASAGSGGSISPTGNVSVNYGGSQSFTITANTGYYIVDVSVNGSSVGAVSSYTFTNVQAAYTISATFAPTPSPTPSPTSTPAPTPTPTSSPTPTPLMTTVAATTGSDAIIDLAISGNVTSSQISNVTIATNQFATSTTVSFTVTGESGTTGFSNITIPKSAVSYGTTPIIYIDSQPAKDQGYTQDSNNYYVWYTTTFSTHKISIVFTTTSSSPNSTALPNQTQSSLPQEAIYGVAAAVAIMAIVAVVLVLRKSKKGKS
jgi:hypothetical protein